jgi:hypothetical protein
MPIRRSAEMPSSDRSRPIIAPSSCTGFFLINSQIAFAVVLVSLICTNFKYQSPSKTRSACFREYSLPHVARYPLFAGVN